MTDNQDPEKQALIGEKLTQTTEGRTPVGNDFTVRIRPAKADDSIDVNSIIKHNLEDSLSSTLDKTPLVASTEKVIKESAKMSSRLVYLVAAGNLFPTYGSVRAKVLRAAAHFLEASGGGVFVRGILGYVLLCPFRSDLTAGRSCYKRTASIGFATLGESLLTAEFAHTLRAALLRDALAEGRKAGYTTVVAEFPYRDDQPGLKSILDVYVEQGFQRVGTLQGVIEKGELALDLVQLQLKL
ncbi:hypothetical protein F4778DRAFT_737676 [Xylariomycetidae sp. FL2044]|nr:hypothetical protein F4778DRAFT_737676 [Xylariomycetidae sp. FL2044]